jgi:hypothetical protein
MSLDVREVYAPENALDRIFHERSVFPASVPRGESVFRFSGVGKKREKRKGVAYQSMKNIIGTAGAKNAGSTCNQLKIPYVEFGHQFMYWANMEDTAIHTARVIGWKYTGMDMSWRARREQKSVLTAVVRVREGFHLRLPDHEAHLPLIPWGICADPHSCLLRHGERT